MSSGGELTTFVRGGGVGKDLAKDAKMSFREICVVAGLLARLIDAVVAGR